MSTRAQVIVKDSYGEQWFYRHSDGYPEGVMPTLEKFLQWVKDGKIRDTVEQSCGWLVLIGYEEYKREPEEISGGYTSPGTGFNSEGEPRDWKVGAYEPCGPRCHGDIEHLYLVDLEKKEIKEIPGNDWPE